ncbi:MAG: hypothetical protein KDA84_07765 [Planctomycetaceae bacterium]|nr:hypothetical protein [Planctomycetaceae bacterium]
MPQVENHGDKLSSYRVMFGYSKRQTSLYLVTRDLEMAVFAAKDVFAALCESNPLKVRSVYVENWQEFADGGGWKCVPTNAHGFREIIPSQEKGSALELKSGSVVKCVLLPERTRKSGWNAQVLGESLKGPITNSNRLPELLSPGTEVELRIGAINKEKTRVQFDWVAV